MAAAARLTLAEELVLVALDDETGSLIQLPPLYFELALAAALVMELSLNGRIDSDPERLFVLSSAPTGNAILDEVLAEICSEPNAQSTKSWLSRLSEYGPALCERIIRSLVERGVLRLAEKRLLWVFKTRVYPPTSGLEEREVKSRVMALLNNDEIPDPRDALLIGLLRGTGILNLLLTHAELDRVRPRINQIVTLEQVSRELSEALRELGISLASSVYPAVY